MSITGVWEEIKVVGAKPLARSAHALAASSTHVFLFGGMATDAEGNPMPLDDTYQLSLDGKAQWRALTPGGDTPVKREGHSFNFVEATGLFYVFGGSNDEDETEFNDVVSFDAGRNVWKQGLLPAGRSRSPACSIKAGAPVVVAVKTVGVPPTERLNHRAAVFHESIYVFGGFEDGTAKGDLHKLDARAWRKGGMILWCLPRGGAS